MLSINKQLRYLFIIFIILFTSQAFAHGMSESEKQIIVDGGNLSYIWIGATHMLSGYDHLAFVFGIIFFLTKFRDIIKYITVFTLGHSITLIFATFNAITINYYLIDAVIALSVCYIAFHNLDGFKKYLHITAPNMLFMIFSLGLIHGLGLSTRLQQLPLSTDDLLMNIISFNIGIEFGQIAALVVMLFIIRFFRDKNSFKVFAKIANVLLIFLGIYLFIIQINDYINSQKNNTTAVEETNWKDTINITIPANGEKEYKIQVDKESSFSYTWSIEKGVLYFDFHAEPQGDTTGYFKTFNKGMSAQEKGSLKAIFKGTHGWYWKNYNPYPVHIQLNLQGEYKLLKSF